MSLNHSQNLPVPHHRPDLVLERLELPQLLAPLLYRKQVPPERVIRPNERARDRDDRVRRRRGRGGGVRGERAQRRLCVVNLRCEGLRVFFLVRE